MKTLFLVRIVLGVVLLSSCVGKNRRREKGSWSHQQIGNFSSTAVFAFEDVNETYEDVNRTKRHYNQHRQHAECGFKCGDGTCIKSNLRCDDYVDCIDVSDETDCKCVDRIGAKKICDGFEDCPLGEDEKGCGFGCGEGKLSCSDGKTGLSSTNCINLSQKCDGHIDCPNSKDEKDCWRLTSFDLKVRGILPEGTLQKNIGGEWHTICASSGAAEARWLQKYSKKTCEIIIGQIDEEPKIILTKASSLVMSVELLEVEPLVFTKFSESENKFTSVSTCSSGLVYNVECPEPKCGYPASKYDSHATQTHRHTRGLTAKIVGGYDSVHGGWPFIVGIFRNGTFHCGASIINKHWILTAAHCTHGYEKYVFEAQAGMTRRNSWSPHEHTRTVKRIFVHERYDSKIFLHDIALMEVSEPFYLSKWVTPACFPSDKSLDPTGSETCKVVGWGDLSEEGEGPDNLQEVDLPILKKCMETFTKDSYQICAGVMEGGKDACQGDSGGPLICEDSIGRHVVNGLVSFGRGCARPNQAGVYTRISAYFSWIESIISGQSHLSPPKPRECSSKCFRAGGECMLDKFVCNQEVDCLGQDDELDCNYVGKGRAYDDDEPGESAYDHIRSASHVTEEHTHEYGSAKLCGPSEFQCKTTLSCIPLHLKCDGKFDCTDSTDEKQCECGDIIENAYPQYKCDGLHHCLDGSDENDCHSKICNGTKGLVRCAKSDQCIRVSRWCDGTPHCLYGEDEADCVRIMKSKNKLPGEGFLNDKVSRGLQSGYVVIRQSSLKWSVACEEEFGDNMGDVVCPYLGMRLPQGTRPVTRHRTTRDASCKQVKAQCGEPECGVVKLYSMAQSRPPAHYLGSLPWLVVVLVEGSPVCPGTLVSKHWILVFASCIDSNVRSTANEYISVMAGFSETTTMVMGPMEQTRRVNSLVRFDKEFILLRVETPFVIDHLANPICIDVGSHVNQAYCIMVKSSDRHEAINEVPVSVDSSCEKEDYNCILVEDRKECHNAEGSFVFCTGGTSWFFLGYVSSLGLSKCSSHGRIQLLNPFYGSGGTEAKGHLNRPPSSIVKAPGCTGTRCTYGNCVANPYVCDGIAHCADNLDERRCQRHYQVLRTYDESTDTPNYGLSSNGTCPEGHFMCKMTLNCIPISAFCDGIYDCGYDDYTDEPENEDDCSCRRYLELAAPERICDDMGKEHCPDRSDERYCPCTSRSFACDVSSSGMPSKCIHQNLVCDYVEDCPNGADENNCIAVSSSLDTVMMDRSKEELEGYVLVRVKGSWHPYCSNEWSFDLAIHVCKRLGFETLRQFKTVELDEIQSIKDPENSYGEYTDGYLEPLLLGLPNGVNHFSDAGPIEDAVSKVPTDEEFDYKCTIGLVTCFKTST